MAGFSRPAAAVAPRLQQSDQREQADREDDAAPVRHDDLAEPRCERAPGRRLSAAVRVHRQREAAEHHEHGDALVTGAEHEFPQRGERGERVAVADALAEPLVERTHAQHAAGHVGPEMERHHPEDRQPAQDVDDDDAASAALGGRQLPGFRDGCLYGHAALQRGFAHTVAQRAAAGGPASTGGGRSFPPTERNPGLRGAGHNSV